MTRIHAGLTALIRQQYGEYIINIHCFSHRLELAFKDVVKPNKQYQKLLDLLIGLHKFYKTHKNSKGLKEASEALNTKVVALKKVTSTRWLPHLIDGINSLLKNFRSYEAHLSSASHTNPKAEGYYKMLVDKGLLVFAFVLKVSLR